PSTDIHTLSLHDALPILLCDRGTRSRSADSEASAHAIEEGGSDAIQKPESELKCHRRKFHSSNRARNFANWLIVLMSTADRDLRSEEHTSELQSPDHLVC